MTIEFKKSNIYRLTCHLKIKRFSIGLVILSKLIKKMIDIFAFLSNCFFCVWASIDKKIDVGPGF